MNEIRYLAPGGVLHANGFPEESLDNGMEHDPHFIGVDAGSVDGGPYSLGSGDYRHSSRTAAKEIYRLLLTKAMDADIPLLIGSAAGGGGDVHVDWTVDLLEEIATEEGLSCDIAAVYADQEDDALKKYIENDQVNPLDKSDPLTDDVVESTDRVVAMMGPEPFIEALDRGSDVVVGGRASDVSIWSAIPIREGFPIGLSVHLAKTLECGALPAESRSDEVDSGFTGSGDVMLGTLTEEYFRLKPTNPNKVVNPLEVAAHLLYENKNPYQLVEPRGTLQTENCTYSEIDDQTVEVRGSEFERADQYTVKIEGARKVGQRATTIMGIRDPNAIENVDTLIDNAKKAIEKRRKERDVAEDECESHFHVYGKNAVMKGRERASSPAHEVGVFIDIVAPSEDVAHDLVEEAGYAMLTSEFPTRITTAGNIGFPVSPYRLDGGEAYEFTVWHQIEIDDPLEPFGIRIERYGGGA